MKVPSGTADNSPAIHCRESLVSLSSPVRDGRSSAVPVVPDGTWEDGVCPTRQ
ncbi:MAG: hypothetical protein GY795_47550 [Desulfobacterales bacterium]|nr:hypothetical protein [Desulfobacterales bacterium]